MAPARRESTRRCGVRRSVTEVQERSHQAQMGRASRLQRQRYYCQRVRSKGSGGESRRTDDSPSGGVHRIEIPEPKELRPAKPHRIE